LVPLENVEVRMMVNQAMQGRGGVETFYFPLVAFGQFSVSMKVSQRRRHAGDINFSMVVS